MNSVQLIDCWRANNKFPWNNFYFAIKKVLIWQKVLEILWRTSLNIIFWTLLWILTPFVIWILLWVLPSNTNTNKTLPKYWDLCLQYLILSLLYTWTGLQPFLLTFIFTSRVNLYSSWRNSWSRGDLPRRNFCYFGVFSVQTFCFDDNLLALHIQYILYRFHFNNLNRPFVLFSIIKTYFAYDQSQF